MNDPTPHWNGTGKVMLIIGVLATIISLWIYFTFFVGDIK